MASSLLRLSRSCRTTRYYLSSPLALSTILRPFSSSLYDDLSPPPDDPDPQQKEEEEGKMSLLPQFRPSDDADLLSEILLQHHNPFHAMESSLQLNGISLTPSLLHQTLIRLRHSSKIALSFFTWAQTHPHLHFGPDPTAFHLIIDSLAKVRQFDAAWHLILRMEPTPTPTSLLILIRRLISSGLTRQALGAYLDIHTLTGIQPDYHHFCYLLDTLCKYGRVKTAMEVFNSKRQKFHTFKPDVKMYTVLIYGWVKINRPEMGEKLLREMVVRHGIEPNVVTFNVMLNGVCRRSRLQPEVRFERTVQAAEKLLDEMRKRGIEPDVMSYSIVLHMYSRAHKPDLSLDKLRAMKRIGISPSVATYTSVVKCLCSCGRIEDAKELLDEMVRGGVSPSAATYNCFFKEYRGRRDADSALELYRKMKEESPHLPSLNTYNVLLGMFVRLDRMDVVGEIWEDMKRVGGVGPDLDSYTMLIHDLCNKKRWREACRFFVEMIEKGLLPRKITFETLYAGLIQSAKLRTWRRLKKRLEEESITFGSEFERFDMKPYRR